MPILKGRLKIFLLSALVAALGSAIGLYLVGCDKGGIKPDETRVDDAMKISHQLMVFWVTKHKWPSQLKALDGSDGWQTQFRDLEGSKW